MTIAVSKSKMLESECDHLRKQLKKQDERNKRLMQEVKKNESEYLRKTLETKTKEKDMYKAELEKYKADNNRL